MNARPSPSPVPLYGTFPNLRQICDKFLQDEIGKKEVEDFARNLCTSSLYRGLEDLIDDTLFERDNEAINVPVNKGNMKLWK